MSLSAWDPFGFYTSLDAAVAASVNAGVVYAVAASNDNDDACDYTPAREPQALTTGATGSNDVRASFSNFGLCLDLFAPGVSILSATNTSDIATRFLNGTSMASPHVAGVAALYLGENPGANPTTVKFNILTNTTDGVVGNSNGPPQQAALQPHHGRPTRTCRPDRAHSDRKRPGPDRPCLDARRARCGRLRGRTPARGRILLHQHRRRSVPQREGLFGHPP